MHRIILITVLLPAMVSAQHLLSVGIKGGIPLSDAFADATATSVDVITHTFSDSKNYVIGPFVELHLPAGFAVEADALYHPLNLSTDTRIVPTTTSHSSFDINSWEFPILAKYHFLHTPIVKPYLEAGPAFRAIGDSGGGLSNKGFAIGGGIDVKVLLVRVTPELRYTRWGSDTVNPAIPYAPSNQNQAQFLLGISF